MDVESRRRWEDYTRAKETMLARTHIPEAPWWVVEAVDARSGRASIASATYSSRSLSHGPAAAGRVAAARPSRGLYPQSGSARHVRAGEILTRADKAHARGARKAALRRALVALGLLAASGWAASAQDALPFFAEFGAPGRSPDRRRAIADIGPGVADDRQLDPVRARPLWRSVRSACLSLQSAESPMS